MSATKDYQMIVRRAIEDPDFRERLIEDPSGTWAEVTGTPVPDDVQMVVLEDSNRTAHMVLPDPSLTVQELDDLSVSGGYRVISDSRGRGEMGRFCCADLSHVVCDDARMEAW